MNELAFNCRLKFPGGFALDASFASDAAVTALFGPTGSGKTTILESIAGLRKPDQGAISLGLRALFDSAARMDIPPERRRIGMVFQDNRLFPHLTVERNLLFGRSRATNRIPLARAIEVLDLAPLLSRYPAKLSGGEKQRVALGRALLSEPELLLLDEPLAALDDPFKSRLLAYLEQIIGEWSIPAVYVSHSQAEVRRFAQRVVVIDAGRVVAQGPPAEALADSPALGWRNAAGPMNLLRIEETRAEPGRTMARIGDQWLALPKPPPAGADRLFIAFPPDAVILAIGETAGLSARNRLAGTVVRSIQIAGALFVEIDAGQPLWAAITPQSAADLALTPGKNVTCLIKTQSLHVEG